MRIKVFIILFISLSFVLFAQDNNGVESNFQAAKIKKKNNKLAEYITSIYKANPFEGVKIVEEKDITYLVSLSVQDISNREVTSTTNRVAQVKARRNAMVFLNGSNITSEQILRTEERITNKGVSYYETYFDEINENATGFLAGMQVLTTFESNNGKEYIYIIYKKL